MKAHTPRPLYRELSQAIQARKNCEESNNTVWNGKWAETIRELANQLPHGSGINGDNYVDQDASHAEKIVIQTEFHHMDDNGYYDGWTQHTITVTPSFSGINLRISGPNRNDIKDHLSESFDYALCRDVTYYRFLPQFPQFAVQGKWEDKDGAASQCYQAWYVSTGATAQRFWNDLDGAMNYAADLMEQAFYAPKVGV